MKHSAEYDAFTNAVERIMAVPKAEILRREAEYKNRPTRTRESAGRSESGQAAFRFPRACRLEGVFGYLQLLAGEFGIGQALAGDLRYGRAEAIRVVRVLALVVTETPVRRDSGTSETAQR